MEENESIVDKVSFDEPGNNESASHCIKEWALLANDSDTERKELGMDIILGSDVNLQNAALPIDVTILEGNITLSDEGSEKNVNSEGFQAVVNNRHQNKRLNDVLSPVTQVVSKQLRLSDNSALINLAFIKGKEENIANLNSVALKESLLKVDSSLKPEQIKYVKDSLKITCNNAEQKSKILEIKSLLGIEIITSSHSALNRQSRDYETLERVIIFGVSIDITDDQVCSETGAVSAKRLQKKIVILLGIPPKQLFFHLIIPRRILYL